MAENFATMTRPTINGMNAIITAARDGRVPFVSVTDVAQAAYDALVAEKSPNTGYSVIGPSLHTYDEVSPLTSLVLCPPTLCLLLPWS